MPYLKYRIKPRYVFGASRRGAKRRGIPFLFTFEEWWEMARYGDVGAYEVGNVKIIPFGDNVREAQVGNQHTRGLNMSAEFRARRRALMMGNKINLGRRKNVIHA
jgi:hypothetical protein